MSLRSLSSRFPGAGHLVRAGVLLVCAVAAAGGAHPGQAAAPAGVEAPDVADVPISELFALRLLTPLAVPAGGSFAVRVQAYNPYTLRPAAGVDVELELEPRDGGRTLRRQETTGEAGEAVFELDAPPAAGGGRWLDLSARARRRGQERRVHETVSLLGASPLVSTDRTLYRPGGVVRIRALFAVEEGGVLASSPVDLSVDDPKGRRVFSRRVETSRFGIAAASWPVPESAEEGEYRVVAGSEGGGEAKRTLRIRPFESARFAVTAEPEAPYVLPGQPVRVVVRATTLVGESISGASVTVTQGSWPESWGPAPEARGVTGDDGRAVVTVDLQRVWQAIPPEPEPYDRRFRDEDLRVRVRHPLSGREETAGTAVRLAREPIQVYLVGGNVPEAAPAAGALFVSTTYADGSPAPCTVRVTPDGGGQAAATLVTDDHGLARLGSAAIAALVGTEWPEGAFGHSLGVRLAARDAAGRQGKAVAEVSFDDLGLPLRVERPQGSLIDRGAELAVRLVPLSTPRGEPLGDSGPYLVEVQRGWTVLARRVLPRIDGPTDVVFPGVTGRPGILEVVVSSLSPSAAGEWQAPLAAGSFLVVGGPALRLEITSDRTSYAPGERATIRLHTTGEGGAPVAAAVGLAAVDRAAELRQAQEDPLPGLGSTAALLAPLEERHLGSEIAGWTLDRLETLPRAESAPPGLELLAEVLLAARNPRPVVSEVDSPIGADRERFSDFFERQLGPVVQRVQGLAEDPTLRRPLGEERLWRLLRDRGGDLCALLDPWGLPYRAAVHPEHDREVLEISSAGRDRRWGTLDDFVAGKASWRYFRPVGQAIEAVVGEHLRKDHELVTDAGRLEELLAAERGLVWDELRDPWGGRYRASWSLSRGRLSWRVESAGPDGRSSTPERYSNDDVTVWTAVTDLSRTLDQEMYQSLAAIVGKLAAGGGPFDRDRLAAIEAGLSQQLRIPFRDPWGRPFAYRVRTAWRYSNRRAVAPIGSGAAAPGAASSRLAPVSLQVLEVRVVSPGPDGVFGGDDDQPVARWQLPLQTAADAAPERVPGALMPARGGLLSGRIEDSVGSPLPGVTIEAVGPDGGGAAVAVTTAEGEFALGLPAGVYRVTASLEGFSPVEVREVTIDAGQVTRVDLALSAAVEEVITVTSESPAIASPRALPSADSKRAATEPPLIATPRLRQDFPETLLWRPEVLTDARGEAEVELPLADNVTTWHVAGLASSLEGDATGADLSLVASQPFVLEPDLPPRVTVGDRIEAPALLTNLTGTAVEVGVRVAPGPGLETGAEARSAVSAHGDERLDLPLRFTRPGQVAVRVTAAGPGVGDAVARTVEVHPYGREVTEVEGRLLSGGRSGEGTGPVELGLTVPAEALPGTARLEVRVFPGLGSQLADASDLLARRPAGCAEQIVSVAYPSLLRLELGEPSAETKARDVSALEAARDALAGRLRASGGFGYWPSSAPDLALTGYALGFLERAGRYVAVDPAWSSRAVRWLRNRQLSDGSWRPIGSKIPADDPARVRLSAAVARALAEAVRKAEGGARTAAGEAAAKDAGIGGQGAEDRTAVRRALSYLAPRVVVGGDPYALAQYTLAAAAAGAEADRKAGVAALRALAHSTVDGTYWELLDNTPFWGRGTSGRFETTGLAVQALLAAGEEGPLARDGLAYLLRERRADDLWGSTQATIQALSALVAGQRGAAPDGAEAEASDGARRIVLALDGRALPPSGPLGGTAPVTVLAGEPLAPGDHRLGLRSEGGTGEKGALVQAVLRYDVAWRGGPESAVDEGTAPAAGGTLVFFRSCRPLEAVVGEPVTCRVRVDRRGYRGTGMLIAEVGLPPGAEVDRTALEAARGRIDGFLRFETAPGRVILYLWPRAAGIEVPVTFRARMALDAVSEPSTLYDYYDPDARVTLAPETFRIRRIRPDRRPPSAAAGPRTAPGPQPPPR